MDYFTNLLSTSAKAAIAKKTGFIDYAKLYKANYREGTLDIHGRPRRCVWTTLAATAHSGSTSFVTAKPCDFEPGDVVVIASTTDDPSQAEELTILAAQSATTYTTMTPLKFTHTATVMHGADYSFSRDIDMSAEVGLLSRNVIVQGDSHSHTDIYGAHTVRLRRDPI